MAFNFHSHVENIDFQTSVIEGFVPTMLKNLWVFAYHWLLGLCLFFIDLCSLRSQHNEELQHR
jgi:hypothetical protein